MKTTSPAVTAARMSVSTSPAPATIVASPEEDRPARAEPRREPLERMHRYPSAAQKFSRVLRRWRIQKDWVLTWWARNATWVRRTPGKLVMS